MTVLVPPVVALPPQTAELRAEVRAFLAGEKAAGGFTPSCDGWHAGWDEAFSRRLAARGWIGMTIPAEYGGHGRSALDRYVVTEELLAAGAPVAAHWLADRQTAPSLLRYGTEEQKRRYLPAIARGECYVAVDLSEPDAGQELRSRAALARVLLIAGAARRALDLTIRYAGEREQFGRPIGNFQAIQQQIAELAAETAAIRTAADAALRRCAADGFADPAALLAVAAAKVQAGRGATAAARIAHQVHGAIGFTEEHTLCLSTTRLWAWRDEAGTPAAWAAELGRRVLAADAPAWHTITGDR